MVKEARDVELRIAEHRAGRGARILAVCVARGIGFEVVRTWAGVGRSFVSPTSSVDSIIYHLTI